MIARSSPILAVAMAVLVASACASEVPSSSAATTIEVPADPAEDEAERGDADRGPATATVIVDGVAHEFTGGSCTVTVAGDLVSEFSNGDDGLNLTSSNGFVLIRATLDGVRWVEPRNAPEPDADDPANVEWSGGLLRETTDAPLIDAAITLHC